MKCPRCGKENPAEVHTCTPLALALAEMLDKVLAEPLEAATILAAAAELRRLHAENEALRQERARAWEINHELREAHAYRMADAMLKARSQS